MAAERNENYMYFDVADAIRDGLLCSIRTQRYGNFVDDGKKLWCMERTSLGSIKWNAQTHVLVVYFAHQPPTTLVVGDDDDSTVHSIAFMCITMFEEGETKTYSHIHRRARGISRIHAYTNTNSNGIGAHKHFVRKSNHSWKRTHEQREGVSANGTYYTHKHKYNRVCAGMCADRLLWKNDGRKSY